ESLVESDSDVLKLVESLIDVDVRSELLVLNDVEVLTEPDVLVDTLCDIDSLDAVEADLLSLVESLNDVDMLVESD
ncbi:MULTISPECIES: hypothetical protein, partial [Escherichia]|uniref:hypothetical protein n=1 Tax=Escherichia TaxID=561 RepID=UPI0023B90478